MWKRLLFLVLGTTLLAVAAPTVARASSDGGENGVCRWGGTPAAPTGRVKLSPGLTLSPSPEDVHFVATGPAEGEPCGPTITFEGILRAGSSCAAQQFVGRAKGIPGVVAFSGPGLVGTAPEQLFDRAGNVVGVNTVTIASTDLPRTFQDNPACTEPGGLEEISFSTVVTLFANGGADG
jgi:hypothetical protein